MVNKESWETMFGKLEEYKKENGHCNVPTRRDKLGRWVEKQRTNYRKNKLSVSQIEVLDSIGFGWKLQNQSNPRNPVSKEFVDLNFNEMLRRVVDYVEREGHGWIPQRYEGDRQLGVWAKNRRSEWKRGTLSEERVEDLNKAGFVWEAKKGRRWSRESMPIQNDEKNL